MPALQKEEIDLVVPSAFEALRGIGFKPLFDHEPVFLASAQHPLARRSFVEAQDFRGQPLISYSVDRAHLDLFTALLIASKAEPAAIRQVELTAVIRLLVSSNGGVAVLPDWVVRKLQSRADYTQCARSRTRG